MDELLFLPRLGRGTAGARDLLGHLDAHFGQLVDVFLLLNFLKVLFCWLLALFTKTCIDRVMVDDLEIW